MTVLAGEKVVVEGFNQFRDILDVEDEEILDAVPESERNAIVESYNNSHGSKLKSAKGPIDEVSELPAWAIDDYVIGGLCQPDKVELAYNILENRDQDYIHLYESPIQTIVKIHPGQ